MRSQIAYPVGRITIVPRTGPLSASSAFAMTSWYQRGKSSARGVSTRAMTANPRPRAVRDRPEPRVTCRRPARLSTASEVALPPPGARPILGADARDVAAVPRELDVRARSSAAARSRSGPAHPAVSFRATPGAACFPDIYAWAGSATGPPRRGASPPRSTSPGGVRSAAERPAALVGGRRRSSVASPVEVTVPKPARLRAPGGLRDRAVTAAGRRCRPSGTAYRSPRRERTAFDLARRLPLRRGRRRIGRDARRAAGHAERLAAIGRDRTGWPGTSNCSARCIR